MVVEDQPRALGEVELVGQREGEELGRDGDLGEAAEHAARGDAVAGRDRRAVGRAAHDAADLAAGHERQRRLELVLAARLQHLGERHARGVDVDDHALPGVSMCDGSGSGRSTSFSALAGPVSSTIWTARMAATSIVPAGTSCMTTPRLCLLAGVAALALVPTAATAKVRTGPAGTAFYTPPKPCPPARTATRSGRAS